MAERLAEVAGVSPSTPSPRRGEGRGEGVRRTGLFRSVSRDQEFLADCFEHAVGIGEHIIVPEAKDAIAVLLDDRGSRRIARHVVLPAVQFDRQAGSSAGKVGDIGVDLELANELLALELSTAKVMPEALFRIRLVRPQLARDRSQAFPSQLSTPSPNPLPAGERAIWRA